MLRVSSQTTSQTRRVRLEVDSHKEASPWVRNRQAETLRTALRRNMFHKVSSQVLYLQDSSSKIKVHLEIRPSNQTQIPSQYLGEASHRLSRTELHKWGFLELRSLKAQPSQISLDNSRKIKVRTTQATTTLDSLVSKKLSKPILRGVSLDSRLVDRDRACLDSLVVSRHRTCLVKDRALSRLKIRLKETCLQTRTAILV